MSLRTPIDLRQHPRATIGLSTGALKTLRGDWPRLVEAARGSGDAAVELAALSEPEFQDLLSYLSSRGVPDFGTVSVHAPTKHRRLTEEGLTERLRQAPSKIDWFVVHPDLIDDPAHYRRLGSRLVIENMDPRKSTGRTAAELEDVFSQLPEAGFCLDLAHARAVDPSMDEAERLLRCFAGRLRQVHLSSLDESGHHVPLRADDLLSFTPLLRRCRHVPWLFESVSPDLL